MKRLYLYAKSFPSVLLPFAVHPCFLSIIPDQPLLQVIFVDAVNGALQIFLQESQLMPGEFLLLHQLCSPEKEPANGISTAKFACRHSIRYPSIFLQILEMLEHNL